jgi:hypothetical protein
MVMPPRYNATSGHPDLSFLLLLVTGFPLLNLQLAFRISPKSDNHRHDLGDILISLRRDRTVFDNLWGYARNYARVIAQVPTRDRYRRERGAPVFRDSAVLSLTPRRRRSLDPALLN